MGLCWARRRLHLGGLKALPGYRPPPAPAPGTWVNPAPIPSVLAQAALESELGAVVRILGTDPKDRLAAALARLGRAFIARGTLWV